MRLLIRLVIYGLAVGIAMAFAFGLNSKIQWEVASGRSRVVRTCIGIPVWFSPPESTMLTEWLGEPEGEVEWVYVRGTATPHAKVSYCVSDVLNGLQFIDTDLKADEQFGGMKVTDARHQIAVSVLDELRTSRSICAVAHHTADFKFRLATNDWFGATKLDSNQLAAAWVASKPEP